MKRRGVLLLCFILFLGLVASAAADEGIHSGENADDDDDDDDDADDDDDDDGEDEDDKWGEYTIDHKLNVPWSYPTDYVEQPLVLNRLITLFGVGFDYKFADQYFNDDGDLVDGPFNIAKQTVRLWFGMGITDNFTFVITFPFSWKKTTVFRGNQNYLPNGENTYGKLAEEALVDYLTDSEGWDLWNFDWPWLGDIELAFRYQVWHTFEPYTTSIVVESIPKWPTGNDNLRRGSEARNNIASGTTDWYNGIAIKQQAWKFSFLARAGYTWRLESDTKYAFGKIDLADKVSAYGEIMFQVPEVHLFDIPGTGKAAFFPTWALGSGFNYWARIGETVIDPVRGDTLNLKDDGGYMMEVMPKVVWQLTSSLDLTFDMTIPISGEKSFLKATKSFYVPPYEIESYDAVGVTYSVGITKRFQ